MSIEPITLKNSAEIGTESKGPVKTEIKTEPYPDDTVELTTNKKNKKSGFVKKTLTSTGFAIAATVGLLLLIVKHNGNRIKKLYDEKLIISNLKENLVFKEAKTVKEGIKFAKEVLGIKYVDENFTLEAINTVNKGLVDVSNANKGRVFMPNALRFTHPEKPEDYSAAVQMNINSQEFGNMYINSYYFNEKFLDEELKKHLFDNNIKLFEFDNELKAVITPVWDNFIYANPSKDVAKLINDYYKDTASLSISRKRNLLYSLIYGKDGARRSFRSPIETLETIERSQKEFMDKNNIVIEFDKLSDMSYKDQKEYLKNLLEKMKKSECYLVKNFEMYSPLKTIYHEMGHLQDAAKNLKELDLKQWKFDWKAEWNNIKNRRKYDETVNRVGVDEIDNRWGSIYKEYYEHLLENNPSEFKKRYPDLYKFLTDKDIQQIAGKVSSYAQSGIGEFIADTYAKMINGQKIPDDVISLYKKYKGPEFL